METTKRGQVLRVSPGLNQAIVADTDGGAWILQSNSCGTVVELGADVKIEPPKSDCNQLPAKGEWVYFSSDEESGIVDCWVRQNDYDSIHEAQQLRLEKNQKDMELQKQKKRQAIERQRTELRERPILRIMEQLILSRVPSGSPVQIDEPWAVVDFLKHHPQIRKYDKFTTSGDFFQKKERWFEYLTVNDEGVDEWIRGDDPRLKTK